jgi:PAS domain S-box-containing protein
MQFKSLFHTPYSAITKLPRDYQLRVKQEIIDANWRRFYFFIIGMLILTAINLYIDFTSESFWEEKIRQLFLYADFSQFILFSIPFVSYKYLSVKSNQVKHFILVFCLIIFVNWFTWISIIDYHTISSFPSLIAGIFVIASLFYLKGWLLLLLYLYVVGLLILHDSFLNIIKIQPSHYINILLLAPLAWGISRILINNKYTSIVDRQKLSESKTLLEYRVSQRTKELTKTNDQLKKLVQDRMAVEGDLREINNTLSVLLKAVPIPLCAIDKNGVIRYIWNTAAEKKFGWVKEEIMDKKIPIFNQEELNDIIHYKLHNKKHRVMVNEVTLTKKNGTTGQFNIYGAPLCNSEGNETQYILSLVDLSERKKYENALKKAWKKAEESDKLKTAFLTNMSHELRTPLNGILGFASLLLNKELPDDKRNYYFNIINVNSEQLLSIVENIIDISKIESGMIEIIDQKTDLDKIMYELEAYYRKYAHSINASEIELYMVKPKKSFLPVVNTDPAKISQIMGNLLKNAFKFTEKGFIEFGYDLFDDNQLLFHVKDTGIGMSKKHSEVVFKSFRQADDSSTRKYGGTGLGLAICKGYLQEMKGKIWVDSKLNEGSTFYFTLPYCPIDEGMEENKIIIDKDLNWKNKTILIVEDDFASQVFISELLKKTHADFIHAANGQQAIDACMDHPVDLVLMDIQLPGMDGYEATRRIKELNHEIPVVAQTANAFPENKKKCLEAGCDDFITKPLKSDALLELVSKFFY